MTKPPPDGILYEDCDTYITGTGQRLVNIHPRIACAPTACVIHNRSDHVMRAFPTHWREDRRFMERICPHGVGHPDPDDPFADPVHGCDGCCMSPADQAIMWQERGYDHTPSRLRRFLERIGLVKRP
jgi:hypothetical protein